MGKTYFDPNEECGPLLSLSKDFMLPMCTMKHDASGLPLLVMNWGSSFVEDGKHNTSPNLNIKKIPYANAYSWYICILFVF